MPHVLLIFDFRLLMCTSQARCSSINTPRNFVDLTWLIGLLSMTSFSDRSPVLYFFLSQVKSSQFDFYSGFYGPAIAKSTCLAVVRSPHSFPDAYVAVEFPPNLSQPRGHWRPEPDVYLIAQAEAAAWFDCTTFRQPFPPYNPLAARQ